MEPAHDNSVLAANMDTQTVTDQEEGEDAMTHLTTAPTAIAGEDAMMGVHLPDLNAADRREPSLHELMDDPIMHLLLARDGVAAEDVFSMVRVMACRIVGNDCGPLPSGLAAA